MNQHNHSAKMLIRCSWAGTDPLYVAYHDEEWGLPCHDDYKLFEFIILETFQAGLSWMTILKKRENFRKAFAGFDPVKVARFSEKKQEALMEDSGIIRNKLKIASAITNAKAFLRCQEEFGSFSAYFWSWVDGKPLINTWKSMSQVPAKTELAETIAKDMKQRGFSFMGPTIVYAHMQAMGLVNDHLVACFQHKEGQKSACK